MFALICRAVWTKKKKSFFFFLHLKQKLLAGYKVIILLEWINEKRTHLTPDISTI